MAAAAAVTGGCATYGLDAAAFVLAEYGLLAAAAPAATVKGGCEAEDVDGDPSRAGLGSAAPLRGVLVGVGRLFGILGGDGVAPKLLPLMLPAKGEEAEAEAFGSNAPPLAAGFDGGRFTGTVNVFFIGGILFGDAGEPGAAPSAPNPGRIGGGAFPAKGGGEDIAFVSSESAMMLFSDFLR